MNLKETHETGRGWSSGVDGMVDEELEALITSFAICEDRSVNQSHRKKAQTLLTDDECWNGTQESDLGRKVDEHDSESCGKI